MKLSLSAFITIVATTSTITNTVEAFAPIPMPAASVELTTVTQQQPQNALSKIPQISSSLTEGIANFIIPPANAAEASPKPPTNGEIKLLRDAFSVLYGERNPEKAEPLLNQVVDAWERQAPDERAALYRVRGDCYMELLKAEDAAKDYTIAIDFLNGPGGNKADPEELPAATLGRGRAMRSIANSGTKLSIEQYKQISNDYQTSLRLSSREEWDTDEENEADGATRNPYAAWEWGMAKRGAGDAKGAAEVHSLASLAFKDIGDRARSVISALDAGIDLAGTEDVNEARKVLESAIKSTTSVEGRDVELLQRVIAKEGEARMALASLLWSSNEKAAAENQFGEACGRLDQLQADADAREKARIKSGAMPPIKIQKLPFTIDDTKGPQLSCSRFKNEKFVSESLLWPESLQQKLTSLNNLSK
jgi:tetratricopeptide (TPR) repeat protein